jgi:hypothetical protein
MENSGIKSQQPAVEGKKNGSESIGENIGDFFQKLRDKYTQPGYNHPDRAYYVNAAFWIVMVCWWIFSVIILIGRCNGKMLEGTVGFILMFIERIGLITLGIACLVWWKKNPSKKSGWKWRFAVIGLAAVSFLMLRNPIRDIPYLFHPAEVVLHDCEKYIDTDMDYAAIYSFWGKDENEKLIEFDVNESTMYDPSFHVEGNTVTIKCLPYTKTMISYSIQ